MEEGGEGRAEEAGGGGLEEIAGGREEGERPGGSQSQAAGPDRRPGLWLLGPQVWGPRGEVGEGGREALLSYPDARALGGEEGQNFRLFT